MNDALLIKQKEEMKAAIIGAGAVAVPPNTTYTALAATVLSLPFVGL